MDRFQRNFRLHSSAAPRALVFASTYLVAFAVELTVNCVGAQEDTQATPFSKRLESLASVHWDGVPLRTGLMRLADANAISILLDRRVDPGRAVTFTTDEIPLRELLARLAEENGLGVSYLSDTVYVGPTEAARMVRTLAALIESRAAGAPVELKRKLVVGQAVTWPNLATPRSIAQDFFQERDVKLVGISAIPHDLWPEGRISQGRIAEQATLLLAGFDLTLTPDEDDSQFRVTTVRGDETVSRRFSIPHDGVTPDIDALRRQVPAANITRDGGALVVQGRIEDCERVAAELAPRTKVGRSRDGDHAPRKKVYSLRVDNQPIGPIIEQLAKQMELKVEYDAASIDAAEISLSQRVSFRVSNVGREELLAAAVATTGLAFEIHGQQLRVFARIPKQ